MELNVKRDKIENEVIPVTYEDSNTGHEFESKLTDLKLDNEISTTSEIALVKNLPSTLASKDSTTEYFTKLAKRLHVQSDLKAILSGKISKRRKKSKAGNVKLKFHSEKGRNHFINAFKEFTSTSIEPSDDLYSTATQLKVSVPKQKSQGVFIKKITKKHDKEHRSLKSGMKTCHNHHDLNQSESEVESSKHHWYQRHFKLKSWKRKNE